MPGQQLFTNYEWVGIGILALVGVYLVVLVIKALVMTVFATLLSAFNHRHLFFNWVKDKLWW